MVKNLIITFSFALSLLASTFAYSGAGHSHSHDHSAPPTDDQIIEKAAQDLKSIVEKGELVEGKKLDKSWLKDTDSKVHKKTFKHYVASFANAQENKTIYILLNSRGTFIKANFSGSFEELQ